jgi:acetoin utilization deacetylase AcuC-like enzyme
VAVVDWDVHHGNGTQEGFYDRDDVLTISMHMDHGAWGPTHVQTGDVDETGKGSGEGYNLNLPLPMGTGDHGYNTAFERCVAPALRKFKPELIFCANGQDANAFDPNGRQCVSMAGFYQMACQLRALAEELCDGKIVITQEGGYNPTYAPYCAHSVAEGLLGLPMKLEDPIAFYPEDVAGGDAAVEALIKRHPLL